MATVRIKGGDRLTRRLTEMGRNVESAKTLRVGFLENATYPDGTPVALVAAVQEFGSPANNIPARPFFRSMVKDKEGEWPDAIAALLKTNGYDAEKTLNKAGLTIAGQLRDSIVNGKYAPLAPATIRRKGFDRPLVDTGHMLNSVDHEVS